MHGHFHAASITLEHDDADDVVVDLEAMSGDVKNAAKI